MQYEKELIEECIHEYHGLEDFAGSLEQTIKMLKDTVKKHKKAYKDLKLEVKGEYEDRWLALFGTREETDEEFNKRVKRSEARRIKKLAKDKQLEEKEKEQLAYLSKKWLNK